MTCSAVLIPGTISAFASTNCLALTGLNALEAKAALRVLPSLPIAIRDSVVRGIGRIDPKGTCDL